MGSTHHQGDSSNFNQRTNQPTTYHLQPTTTIRPVGRIVILSLQPTTSNLLQLTILSPT
ncbi:MAG TPA: hypothetical protein VJK54_10360 [Chthoniobacterales bacterium]|nr:hypothetical protein [Chthoniobacterales bacterium]